MTKLLTPPEVVQALTDGKEVWTDTVMFDCSDNDYYIYFDGSNPETVTHWQPLPKPPKEK